MTMQTTKRQQPKDTKPSSTPVGLFAALTAGGLMLTIMPAQADLVLQSVEKAPGLTQGTTVPDDHTFDLPEGATLNLLQTPSGESFQMRGPYQGTLETFVKNCSGWLAFTRAYCKSEDGDQLPLGGTRGVQQ